MADGSPREPPGSAADSRILGRMDVAGKKAARQAHESSPGRSAQVRRVEGMLGGGPRLRKAATANGPGEFCIAGQ
jgi:hypothetical protein